MALHAVLLRQLGKLCLSADEPPSPERWRLLLQRVSQSYADADGDRYTLERSIDVSSAEMTTLYDKLTVEHEWLTASEERLRAVFTHTSLGKLEFDQQGRCIEPNLSLQNMLGWSEQQLVGQQLLDLVHTDDVAAFLPSLLDLLEKRRSHLSIEHRWRTQSGTPIWVDVTISRLRTGAAEGAIAVLFVQEVTERKRMEMELAHAQRLQSVGRLAAGLAHELNTPIQFISDNLRFLGTVASSFRDIRVKYRALLEKASRDPATPALLDRIDEEADIAYLEQEAFRAVEQALVGSERMGDLVSAMKDFAQQGRQEHAMADLNLALLNVLTVARTEFEGVAEIETQFAKLPSVGCNLAEINQVFLALLINAAHAIADVGSDPQVKGRISIRTRQDGKFIVISISDTGVGIPEADHHRIFDPFFTTREVGRGTGQGLAIARSIIVDRHHGAIRFTSRQGEGSTFEVLLPIKPTKPELISVVALAPASLSQAVGGDE